MPPVIAVTSGEPAGIGPELCLRLAGYEGDAQPVILGDRSLLEARAAHLGLAVSFRDFCPKNPVDRSRLDVLHIPLAVPAQAGQLNAANGSYVLALLDRALAGCRSGEFAAMATAPVHKGVINDAGVHFTGHTEYLAEKTDTPLVVMMLAGDSELGPLRVALVTTHLPLKDVSAAITTDVLEKLRAEGMQLSGPYPADTMFTPPILAQGDAVLAMYHDQGLTALKYATFGKGINVTLGLPIIRTSVDHGTALELAGTGKADPGSLFEAVAEAARMATRKQS